MNILSKINNSRKIILEMLELRDYDISKYNNYNLDQLSVMFNVVDKKISAEMSPMDIITDNNSSDKKMYIKYLLFSKIRTNNLKDLIDNMIESTVSNGDDIIFIVKDSINNKESFELLFELYLGSNNNFIQIFCIDDLLTNITKHVLNPKMRIISNEEKKNLMSKYKLDSLDQLPIIKKIDPLGKFYGMKKGDVCEILRPSETSGIYKSYRLCD